MAQGLKYLDEIVTRKAGGHSERSRRICNLPKGIANIT
jgi:hypothetical protein